MVVVDVVNVAVLVFVPCELRPGAILAQSMQALGVIRNKGLDRTLLWSRRCGLKGFVTGLSPLTKEQERYVKTREEFDVEFCTSWMREVQHPR